MHFKLLLALAVFANLSCQPYSSVNRSNPDDNSSPSSFFTKLLEEMQTYAATFKVDLENSHLENSTISIFTNSGTRVSSQVGKLQVQASDPNDALAQVAAYYWLSFAAHSTFNRLQTFWALNKDIQVVLNDGFTGWNPRGNSIHIQKPKNGNYLPQDASILVYLLGVANAHHATEGRISSIDESKHKACGKTTVRAHHCCKDQNGCGQALVVGAADYFNTTIFSDHPTLEKSWGNRINGLQACGLNRDLEENQNLTIQEAFHACSSKGDTGYIYNMGTVYASIWWQVRKVANTIEVDQLYQAHLSKLEPEDDFASAFEKTRSADQVLFSGKHTELFRSEFLRRGIALP